MLKILLGAAFFLAASGLAPGEDAAPSASHDALYELQAAAIRENRSAVAHWGYEPENYKHWSTHSNRLIPIYSFGTGGAGKGIDLDGYTGAGSVYRDAARIRELYGYDPPETLNANSEYCDQTDVYRIQ
jgi:alkaline phosphatase